MCRNVFNAFAHSCGLPLLPHNQSFSPTPGVPFGESLEALLKQKLHVKVSPILWVLTSQSLETEKVPIDKDLAKHGILQRTSLRREKELFGSDTVLANQAYSLLVHHYNRLVDLHEELDGQFPLERSLSLDQIDRQVETESVAAVRLTIQAVRLLDAELDRLEALLYQARATRLVMQG